MSQEASDLLVELGRLVWSMGAHLARTDECPPLPCCAHATDDLKEHCHYCQVRLTGMATVVEAGEIAVSENETGIPGVHGDRGSLAVGTVAVIQCLRTLEAVVHELAAATSRDSDVHDLQQWLRHWQTQIGAPEAPPSTAPHQSWVENQIVEKTREATGSVETAFKAIGQQSIAEDVCSLLESPHASSVAKAVKAIAEVRRSCNQSDRVVLQAAERPVRDILILRCHCQSEPRNRESFIAALERAFDTPAGTLNIDLKSVLLLAHTKGIPKFP